MTTTVSPDFANARVALRQWFADRAGLLLNVVSWEDEPRPMVVGTAGMMNLIADVGLGRGERQHKYNAGAPAGQQIERAVGQPRVMTLSLKLDGYDQRLDKTPLITMGRVATRLHGDDSHAALRALRFALVDVIGPTEIPRVDDASRVYPRANLDVRLGYTLVLNETPTTWVEFMKFTSKMRDVDEVLLPTPPNATVTV